MKKRIFIAVFFLILLIPFVGMSVYHADLSIEKKHEEALPSLIRNGRINTGFFQGITDYVADHFAFRQEMITADAGIKAGIFHSSANEKVIVGKKGWLFFQETMNDYQKRNLLSGREIHNCATVVRLIEQGVELQGAEFAFTVAPNKNTLYGKYMPDRFEAGSGEGNLEHLIAEMKKQKVHYVNLRTPLRKGKNQVYHKLDTHWNNLGASIACETLLDYLGKDHIHYENESYLWKKNFSGDLQGMLFPKSRKKDWNAIYDRPWTYEYVNNVTSTEQMEIQTENQTQKDDQKNAVKEKQKKQKRHKSLVMYRDSFGNALVPFMAQEYLKGYFTKEVPYDLSLVDAYKADDVMIELAQRQIPTLLEGVPYMMAPGVAFDQDVQETGKTAATMEMREVTGTDGVLRISGETDKRWTDDDSEIYISMYGKKNLLMFEAFPSVYDPMDEKADRAYSYGAYIDTSSLPRDRYQIEVITKKDGSYYTTGFLGKYVVT
mgnify:FL=1